MYSINIDKTKYFASFSLSTVLLSAPALAQAIEERTLQLATIASPGNLWLEVAERYAQGVEEATNGKVEVQISHSGMTGSVRDSVEALQFGTNDIVQTVVASLAPYDSIAAIESYPYLFRDPEHFKAVFSGQIGDELYKEISKKTNFTLIGAGYRGSRQMASTKPVESVDDLDGLKIRVPELAIFRRTWEMLGASPVPMGSSEVYTSLQQGVIDAAENPLEAHLRSRYYEAADYVVMTDHVDSIYTFLLGNDQFSSFSPELQGILEEEGRQAMQWGTEQSLKNIEKYEQELVDKGATIIRPDKQGFKEKLAPLADEFPELKPWVERISSVE